MSLQHKSDRSQFQMIALDSMISSDNSVRVIDEFMNILNPEELGFKIAGKSVEGRPAYDIHSMIKLYVYGYLNSVRSSRKLARECVRNIELWWLIGELKPKHVTIANFRKENPEALKNLFKFFNTLYLKAGLFSKEVVAIDGSKFRAVNSKKNNYNAKKIQQHLEYIDKQTTEYLQALDDNDKREKKEKMTGKTVEETLQKLKERKHKYETLDKQLSASGQTQISTTDADARALPLHMNIVEVSYNVQAAVEETNKLIVNYEVTNELDFYALSPMAIQAKEDLQIKEDETLTVLADKGYYTGSEIKECHENGIETIVSPKKNANEKKEERYQKRNFTYNKEEDVYICPEGNQLKTNGQWYNKNSGTGRKSYKVQHYKISYSKCDACPFKQECVGSLLNNSHGKVIERTEYDNNLERNNEKVAANITLYKKRQTIVEHRFGTQKRQWGYTHTLLKGKKKVTGEFALIFLCYNLRRIMSIIKDNPFKFNLIIDFMQKMGIWRHMEAVTIEMKKMKKWLQYSPQKKIYPNFEVCF